MRSFVETALRFVQVIGKLFVVRAYASVPMTREEEAKLRAFMAADPTIWGQGRRP
jgi:hypothetical protein